MTHALNPHRSCDVETHGVAIGSDETRLWRVVLGPNNLPALHPCEMPFTDTVFTRKLQRFERKLI
jgi:hypothetical protein